MRTAMAGKPPTRRMEEDTESPRETDSATWISRLR